jgi:predicted phosphodiesterase
MYIRIISDVHTEFMLDSSQFEMEELNEDNNTILIIAGDFGVGTSGVPAIRRLAKQFKHIVYICGNHEFYRHTIGITEYEIQSELSDCENVHMLIGEYVEIDNIRIWGHTFWTSMDDGASGDRWFFFDYIKQYMNDFKVISRMNESTGKAVRFTPDTAYYYYVKAKEKLTEFLNLDWAGHNVVVTHHAPSYKSVDNMYAGERSNPAYCSRLDDYIKKHNIALWIHGHMHTSKDYMIGDTRVICNAYGYTGYDLNSNFNPELRIDLGDRNVDNTSGESS